MYKYIGKHFLFETFEDHFVFRFSSPKVKEKSYSLKFFIILLSTKSNAQFEHKMPSKKNIQSFRNTFDFLLLIFQSIPGNIYLHT